jgi:hypothetical protein
MAHPHLTLAPCSQSIGTDAARVKLWAHYTPQAVNERPLLLDRHRWRTAGRWLAVVLKARTAQAPEVAQCLMVGLRAAGSACHAATKEIIRDLAIPETLSHFAAPFIFSAFESQFDHD